MDRVDRIDIGEQVAALHQERVDHRFKGLPPDAALPFPEPK